MNTVAAAWILAVKDLRCFVRDRSALVLAVLVPIALVTVFGWIMAYAFGGGGGGTPQVSLHVADFAQTEQSRQFVEQLDASNMVRVRTVAVEDGWESLDQQERTERLSRLVSEGDAHHILVIPSSDGDFIADGAVPELQMLRDPGRSMEDQLIRLGLMQASIGTFGGSVFEGAMDRMLRQDGMSESSLVQIQSWMHSIGDSVDSFYNDDDETGETFAAPADTESESIEGDVDPQSVAGAAEVETADGGAMDGMMDFISEAVPLETVDISPPDRDQQVTYQQAQSVAGMSVMMLLFALTSCGSVLIKEREDGTLQRLFAQQITRDSILLGKFFFVFLVGICQMSILFIYGEWMFGVGLFRDPVTLVVLTLTWVAAGGAFGVFLAGFSSSTKQAESLASLLILVMAALGGCWFPLQMMTLPPFLEAVCKSTMTYWAMSGFQAMLWQQLPWYSAKSLMALGFQWLWVTGLVAGAIYFYRRNYCRG